MAHAVPGTVEATPPYARGLTAAIVAIGFGLRLHGFTEPWLNPDEGIYFQLAHARFASHLFDGIAQNAHPPLQYLLLYALAGVSSDFSWLRAPSLLAGGLTVYAMIRLGEEAAGWRAGILAGAALAVAPGAIVLSQVMRPYALLSLLLTTAAWFALRAVRTGRPRDLVVHTAALGLALCTHYVAYLALPWFAVLLLSDAFRPGRPRRDKVQRGAAQVFLMAIALTAYLLHLRPFLWGSPLQREAQRGWLAPFMPDGALEAWLGFVGAQRYLFGPSFEAIAVLLFAAGLGWLLASGRWRPALLCTGVVATAVAAALLHWLPLGNTRHSIHLAVFTLPVMAAPLGALWRRGWRSWLPAAACAGLALAWPGVPRSGVGLDANGAQTPHDSAEHVTSAAAVGELLARVDPWTRRPMLVVMDRQTFYFLAPALHTLSSPDRHGRGAVLTGFRWGSADVVVSQAWTLRVGPLRPDAPDHLDGFLERAARALPNLRIRERRSGALLFAGWNVDRYAALKRQAPAGSLTGWRATPGLVSTQIDWHRYRAGAQTSGAPDESDPGNE